MKKSTIPTALKIFFVTALVVVVISVLEGWVAYFISYPDYPDKTHDFFEITFSYILNQIPPLVVAAVIWLSRKSRDFSINTLFEVGLVTVSIFLIQTAIFPVITHLIEPTLGDYWVATQAAPLLIMLGITAIMINRLRQKGEW